MDKSNHLTRQVEIIHLSDIHFGERHRYQSTRTAEGGRGAGIGIPKLIQLIEQDLATESAKGAVIICITGDITTTASYDEFEEAEEFIAELSKKTFLGCSQSPKSIFLVPGNHDVNYKGNDVGKRWQSWMEFCNRFYNTDYRREDPWGLATAHDLIDELGVVVLTLNSCIYVQKDTPSEQRGEIDDVQLLNIKQKLESIPKGKLDSSIRIALIHHHPILIPSLVEANRGYDAVVGSEKLLEILHDFGFHVLLHGHKHYPLTFLEKTNRAFIDAEDQPLMVVAGGSAGVVSAELPDHPKKTNCYNRVTVKWHPAARQARIRVTTRGLVLYNNHKELLPGEWKWETLRVDDKSFYAGDPLPIAQLHSIDNKPFDQSGISCDEARRIKKYQITRGNFPVVEVMPSLEYDQAYEARFWIVRHNVRIEDIPVEVRWSAGKKFPVLTIRNEEDENYCGVFNYWGPMLIQAHIKFQDGKTAKSYIYARIPIDHQI